MATPRFDPTITLGNVLTVVGIIITVALGWNHLESRVTTVEANLASVRLQQQASEQLSHEAATEIRGAVRDVDQKLSALLIQGYHGLPSSVPMPSYREPTQ